MNHDKNPLVSLSQLGEWIIRVHLPLHYSQCSYYNPDKNQKAVAWQG
ncbi:hypothetical protein [Calothrix sp. FACHB-168]|nr:hypothetical protein [Calothrix sp. FACHB-168]